MAEVEPEVEPEVEVTPEGSSSEGASSEGASSEGALSEGALSEGASSEGVLPEGSAEAESYLSEASYTELLLPPLILVSVIITGLILYSMYSQSKWWRRKMWNKQINSRCKATLHSLTNTVFTRGNNTKEKLTFFTEQDQLAIANFESFQNRPRELLLLSLPCIICLTFCPATILLYQPIVDLYWPKDQFAEPPKVNDVIASFLTPAGLVYAIAFGFAFQEALGKQAYVTTEVSTHLTLLEHLTMLTVRIKAFSIEQKKEVLTMLKTSTLDWMHSIVYKKAKQQHEESCRGIWRILDLLQSSVQMPAEKTTTVDTAILEKMINCAMELDGRTSDRMGQLHSSIHLLQWAFLETLGYFSFFGILFLRADSYRLELTLCILTVVSIAMFCYVLSDLDSPFHGVFRVRLQGLPVFLTRLQGVYDGLDMIYKTKEAYFIQTPHK